jgi:hypothetical protein
MSRTDLLLLALWLACCFGVGLVKTRQEEIRPLELPAGGDSPVLPVLDDLKAVFVGEVKLSNELGRPAEFGNQGPIGVLFSFHPSIVHERCTKSTPC